MKLEYTVEYKNPEDDYLDVEFEGDPRWDNDSFDYSGTHCTGGVGGTCKLPDYTTMEGSEITWDKSLYTTEQNNIIETWLADNDNCETLHEKFCAKLEEENKEYCDY